jgi:hypothetical protein
MKIHKMFFVGGFSREILVETWKLFVESSQFGGRTRGKHELEGRIVRILGTYEGLTSYSDV